ncbi:protein of unknown function [Methanoculleus bourgensis]|uniref:Uncharacterized protein n=1 Tax=Methanoculleus bourgensis TaxID=83986 RepID=A0A0X3BKT9_9EURY|nr:protein of unknown function [Methanoculleus bourgensis]
MSRRRRRHDGGWRSASSGCGGRGGSSGSFHVIFWVLVRGSDRHLSRSREEREGGRDAVFANFRVRQQVWVEYWIQNSSVSP